MSLMSKCDDAVNRVKRLSQKKMHEPLEEVALALSLLMCLHAMKSLEDMPNPEIVQ